jgi:S1-C subfamily serine protease
MIARSKLGTFFVRVLKTANKPDLCLLEGVRFSRAIPFADKAPTVGSNTISIGHPAGGKKKISWGKYKGKQRLHIPALRRVECDNYNGTICWWIFDTMHSTSYTIGGSSGSPLMNDKGELIGVIFAGDKKDDGYAIPLDQVNGFISDL